MAAILRKILLRLILLMSGLVVLNFIYKSFFLEADLQEHSSMINQVREAAAADVIYLGESSDISFSSYDIDKRSISAFIADYYPGLIFKRINKDASHGEVYLSWLRNIPKTHNIKTVIITMNLRSFGPEWIYSDLESAIQKSLVLMAERPPLLNRFILSFKAYDDDTPRERNKDLGSYWKTHELRFTQSQPFGNAQEWREYVMNSRHESMTPDSLDVAVKFILTYGFEVDVADNPRIGDFDKMVELAKERNWHLVFNLLAEDVHRAQALVGKELADMIRRNRDVLTERYTAMGATVVNNLEAVPTEVFIDQGWATEHYAQEGRRIVAQNVAESLRKFHGKDFKSYTPPPPYRAKFFNNLDSIEEWGQSNTKSDEMAFSGRYASRTGKGQDYSLTLTYPMKYIPDSSRNQILVSMQVFRPGINDAGLAISFDSTDVAPVFVSLNELVPETGSWQQLQYIYNIPEPGKAAPLVRVFIHNTSRIYTYADDIRVEFR